MNWKKLLLFVHIGTRDVSTNNFMHFIFIPMTKSYILVNSGLGVLYITQKLAEFMWQLLIHLDC